MENLFGWFRRPPAQVLDLRATPPARSPRRPISNADLSPEDIPSEDADWNEWSRLVSFAASFDGYHHWGSLEKCFDVERLSQTRELRDLTLTELRTRLFCMYRAINHMRQVMPEQNTQAQALLVEIRDRVRRRAID